MFHKIVQSNVVDETAFTVTPILWFLLVVAFAYARHRHRMVCIEKSRYYNDYYVKNWFDTQQREEKERGVHEIDGTVRDRDFRYDDVKIRKEDFKILCRCLNVQPYHRYGCWDEVIYVSRTIHVVVATLSLIACFVASFTLTFRAINNETEAAGTRVALFDIIDAIIYWCKETRLLSGYQFENKLCAVDSKFSVRSIDQRKLEFNAVVINNLLRSANDAVTRITSLWLVLGGFCVMFKLWLVAYVSSRLRRPTAVIPTRRLTCMAATERHTQLVTFLLPMSVIACVLFEVCVFRIRSQSRSW